MHVPRFAAKGRTPGLLAFSFLFAATAAFAQISAIEGDVKAADGSPMKGAEILIERKDMKGTYKGAKTDKKGHYIYNGLPLGTYKVSLLVDKKVVDSVDNVKTKLGDPTPIDFDMKKAVAEQAAVQKAVETGTLTKEQERGLSKEQRDALEKRAKENAAALAKNKELNDAFNAGREALQAKNYDAAITSFQKASEIGPEQNAVWGYLAESYSGLANTKTGADQTAALDKAIEAYNKAIALRPDDAAYMNNLGQALAKEKKIPEAQAAFAKAAQIDPQNAGKYYFNLGAILVNTGQNDAAGEAFKKAIELDPNYADAYYQYGVYLVSKATVTADGKVTPPAGTTEAFQKYLDLRPTGSYSESAKGMLATLQGSVSTTYQNPAAPKKSATKKK